MELVTELEAVGAAAYAMLLGGVVGFERELKNRPAGFRTHMLVAGAAALLMGVGRVALQEPPLTGNGVTVQADPLRLVEAVIAGVSFIGAGTIFARRRGEHVAGITTAASLLMVAVLGLLTGLGHFLMSTAGTLLTLLVLTLLNVVERRTGLREGQSATGRRSSTRPRLQRTGIQRWGFGAMTPAGAARTGRAHPSSGPSPAPHGAAARVRSGRAGPAMVRGLIDAVQAGIAGPNRSTDPRIPVPGARAARRPARST